MPVIFYKNQGETPLEALERFRIERIAAGESLQNVPMTYAGRLDPMAEGLLLILVGEECKQKEKYLVLDKTYETEIVLGIETDTYDALGLAKLKEGASDNFSNTDLQKFLGKFKQEYPAYSSKTVNGKPLFSYARAGELDEIEIPTKDVEIYSIELLGENEISAQELLSNIEKGISKVKGDFRQEEILKNWENLLSNPNQSFKIIKINVKCSSGTYIRSLANKLGGFALTIKRTEVGEFNSK